MVRTSTSPPSVLTEPPGRSIEGGAHRGRNLGQRETIPAQVLGRHLDTDLGRRNAGLLDQGDPLVGEQLGADLLREPVEGLDVHIAVNEQRQDLPPFVINEMTGRSASCGKDVIRSTALLMSFSVRSAFAL